MNTRCQDDSVLVHAIDLYVARQLKELRKKRRVIAAGLAGALGMTSREYGRYESCAAPMPIGILYTISVHFGVPITHFYPDAGRTGRRERTYPSRASELLHHFGATGDPALQRALVERSALLLPSADNNGETRRPLPGSETVVMLRQQECVPREDELDIELSTPRSA